MNESNPWITQNKKVVYANNWIQVEEHDVLNPAGNPGIYGVVKFRNLAIGIIPIDNDGNTWLVGQYRYPLDTYTWEIPEGGGDPQQTPLESAQRELLEETGLVADHFELILTLQTSNSCTDEIAYIFVATGLQQSIPNPEETEQISIRKLPLTESFAMVQRGEIQDAMSVAGLLKVQLSMQ
jgi:8-oxo-dGTP pyrophosphatase MutT (NUDIX family)